MVFDIVVGRDKLVRHANIGPTSLAFWQADARRANEPRSLHFACTRNLAVAAAAFEAKVMELAAPRARIVGIFNLGMAGGAGSRSGDLDRVHVRNLGPGHARIAVETRQELGHLLVPVSSLHAAFLLRLAPLCRQPDCVAACAAHLNLVEAVKHVVQLGVGHLREEVEGKEEKSDSAATVSCNTR